jgi:hypothetical protein
VSRGASVVPLVRLFLHIALQIRIQCAKEEDDPDAGEFMVQCETCKAWQHGLCMGYEAEDQLPDDDYHCEQCRPDLHIEIKKYVPVRYHLVSHCGLNSFCY